MKINYHNELELKIGSKSYKFYNTMLDSVYEKIANLNSFFDKIAIGNGISEDFLTNFKLSNFVLNVNLETENIQNDVRNENLYIKKQQLLIHQN